MKLKAWFTKGLISGGFIYSQYHLMSKECKTSRYITDRGVKSRGQMPYVYSTHELRQLISPEEEPSHSFQVTNKS